MLYWNDVRAMYPIVTSNMLLPTELDTAMSPNPFLATMTLVMRSGMLVPAAKNVNPITCVHAHTSNNYCNPRSTQISHYVHCIRITSSATVHEY